MKKIKMINIFYFICFLCLSCQSVDKDLQINDCSRKANILVVEGTLICNEQNDKVYAGGLVHLIGKDKTAFNLYVLEDNNGYEIIDTYSFEPSTIDFSKSTSYFFEKDYLVCSYLKEDDEKIDYKLNLKSIKNFDLAQKLAEFEKVIEVYSNNN